MKLNLRTQGYALKNSAKRQKRVKEGHCFKYNSKDYLSPNYLILILRASSAKINLTKINFYLFSLKRVFLNKLF